MRIALLEDDEPQAHFMQLWLESVGHTCLCFATGADFMRAMERESFDLLIFDWMLPDTSGDKILVWVRERFGHQIPIIFVTTRDSEQDIVHVLEQGADDYLVKPVKPLELVARITALARRSQVNADQEALLRIGPYTVDRERHRVRRGGTDIELTHKEFELATFLFRHTGQLLSRSHILEQVWGRSADQNTRTVDTHVSRLRNKLELTPDTGWQLRAIYHHGYRLERTDSHQDRIDAA